jgi:multicomponent Na+:H+ antiporter subunit G
MPLGPIDIICILLVLAGLLFFFGAAVGLLRFPDFYTRMHAAGKGDTLSTLLIMAGAGLYELNHFDLSHGTTLSVVLVVIKIMAIGIFIMLTSPTSTHALMQAGYDDDIEPVGEQDEMRLSMPGFGAGPTVDLPAVETRLEQPEAPAAPKKPATRKKVASAKRTTLKKKAPAKKAAAKKVPTKTAKKKAAKKTTKKTAAKKLAKKVARKKAPAKKTAAKKKTPPRKDDKA